MADRIATLALVAVASLGIEACTGGPPVPLDLQVSDSLGFTVLHHGIRDVETIAVAASPEIILGSAEGAELFRVRGALLRPRGGIAVANGGSQEIYLFSPAGRLEQRVGGDGQGPAEFSNILWISSADPDGFVVYDAGNQRVTRWTDAGVLLDSWPVPYTERPNAPERAIIGRGFGIGVTAGDETLMIPWAVAELDGAEGPFPVTGVVQRVDRDGITSEVVDSVDVRWWYERAQPEGPPIEQMLGAPVFLSSTNGPWTAYTEATGFRLVVLNSGEVDYVVTEDRSRVGFKPDSLPVGMSHASDSLPSYEALTMDSNGRIWVRSATDAEAEKAEWRVVTDHGRRIMRVELPTASVILDAQGDRVVLLERDELGVETVVVRRLVEPRDG